MVSIIPLSEPQTFSFISALFQFLSFYAHLFFLNLIIIILLMPLNGYTIIHQAILLFLNIKAVFVIFWWPLETVV